MKILISVEQAISLIKKNVGQGITQETIALEQALGYILAEDIFAPISLPPFRQSAMDGYALNYHSGDTFDVMGEVKAGDSMSPILKKGQCVRIFTGAMVPKTANVVIKQESVLRNEDTISVQQDIVPGSNIRPEGEQIKANELALSRGTYFHSICCHLVLHVCIWLHYSFCSCICGTRSFLESLFFLLVWRGPKFFPEDIHYKAGVHVVKRLFHQYVFVHSLDTCIYPRDT